MPTVPLKQSPDMIGEENPIVNTSPEKIEPIQPSSTVSRADLVEIYNYRESLIPQYILLNLSTGRHNCKTIVGSVWNIKNRVFSK